MNDIVRAPIGVVNATGASLNASLALPGGKVDFGYQLAKRGFVVLCIGGGSQEEVGTADGKHGIQPLSYMAYAAANCSNALANLPEVDPKRIGFVGHSFGGKWAMFASCLHDKFACAVWIDPGIVWNEKDANANYWEKWYLGYQFDKPADGQREPGIPQEGNPRTGAVCRSGSRPGQIARRLKLVPVVIHTATSMMETIVSPWITAKQGPMRIPTRPPANDDNPQS
jgi:hypothetical protein